MTEQEWLTATDPDVLWDFLSDKVSDRKYQLYAVAWCRRIWDLFPTMHARGVVDALEQLADGTADQELLENAKDRLLEDEQSYDVHSDTNSAQAYAHSAAVTCWGDKGSALASVAPDYCQEALHVQSGSKSRDLRAELRAQAEMVREFFPNPFRPVTLDPRWLSSTVLDLARTIYEERLYERMPILADALMDAGCDGEEIINHCQESGPHVRGCWVVDLILSKE